jgi:F-type H+-transporting ATPase subunit gamma
MKMVAAAKFRKAQARITELKPYAREDEPGALEPRLYGREGHPLLQARPAKKVEILILTGDRGLCGAFNTNVMKAGLQPHPRDAESRQGGQCQRHRPQGRRSAASPQVYGARPLGRSLGPGDLC